MRRIRTRLWATLLSLCLLLSLLPTTALAGGGDVTTYEELKAKLESSATGAWIDLRPNEDFGWPSEPTVLTIRQNIYLYEDWTVPANVKLVFTEQGNSFIGNIKDSAGDYPTLTLQGSIETDSDTFLECNKVVVDGDMKITLPYGCLYIGPEYTWTINQGKTLTITDTLGNPNTLMLAGTLTGGGSVNARIEVRDGYKGSDPVNATLSGTLTLGENLTIRKVSVSNSLTIPAGSTLTMTDESLVQVEGGTLNIEGSLISESMMYRCVRIQEDGLLHIKDGGSLTGDSIMVKNGGTLFLDDGGEMVTENSLYLEAGSTFRLAGEYESPYPLTLWANVTNPPDPNNPPEVGATIQLDESGVFHAYDYIDLSTKPKAGNTFVSGAITGDGTIILHDPAEIQVYNAETGDYHYYVQNDGNIPGVDPTVKIVGAEEPAPAVDSVSFGTSGPQHTLNWSFPDGVTEKDLANCHLKLELYDADAGTWVLWNNGVYPRLNGGYILEDLLSDSDRPRGHFTQIRVSTVANSDSSVLGSCEEAIDLTVSEAQASDLSAKAVFTKESDGQYTVETSGLTVGQVYCVITDYINESQAHTQVLATAGGVSATSETMTAENVPVVGDRESLLANASYRVLQFDTTRSSATQLSMTITDKSGWKPVNEAAADVTKATKVYFKDCRDPGYNGCSVLEIVFNGELTALKSYDVYLYHQETAAWSRFMGAWGTSGTTGYVMDVHALNRNLDGHYTKVRVVSHPLDDSLGDAVYEQDIDLTVTNQTPEDSGCSVVYTRTGETETDALYTVNVTGLPEGDYYRIETYSEPSFDSTELTDVLGHTVASNSSAELSAKVKLDNDHLMKDAYYLARSVDSTQDGNTTCTMTITNLTGWKQCFPPCVHVWSDWTEIPATCTKDGSKTRSCSLCHEVETQTIPALGHDYQAVVTQPTCTEQGYTTHTCSRCDASYRDAETDALGHDWSTNDCTQQATCSRCNAVRPAGTHVWGDWTVTKEATCTEDGSKTRSCTSCGHQETEVIPALGHAWGNWVVTKEPTETEEGSQTRTCSRCGAEETQFIARLEKQDVVWTVDTVTWTYGDVNSSQNTAHNDTEDGGALTYSSSNPAVATVDEDGKATIVGAGTTTITATATSVPGKYVETSASYTLTINKAPLTITANNAAIAYGEVPANAGWTGTGYVYEEDTSVVTGTPVYSFNYEQYGAAGDYQINVSGLSAKNYEITYAPGTLTVNKATAYTIVLGKLEQMVGHVSSVSVRISPWDNTAEFSVEYKVNGEWGSELPSAAGTYEVRAALISSENITPKADEYTTGTLTIRNGSTVSVGETTVSVGINVENGKAEITVSDEQLNEILTNADGDVSMNLSGVKDTDELVLPGNLISGLSQSETADSLTVATEDASVVLSGPVLDTVADAVTGDGDQISVKLAAIEKDDLSEAQQKALESISQEGVIVEVSLVITHEDQSITELHQLGGNAEVKVPYDGAVPAGKYVVVCYLSDDGNVTYLRAAYDETTRQISFNTNHFSHYAVFVSEQPAVIVTDGGGSGLYAVGDTVKITAASKSGYRFDHWKIVSGTVTLANANSVETTFTMPAYNVEIAALYTKSSSGGISGGGSTPTYGITVETARNGSVSVETQKAAAGDTVTLTVKPDQGYTLDTLTVIDQNGKETPVTEKNGKYTFIMPGSKVTVKAIFKSEQSEEMVFTDVPADAYYAEAVEWAVARGITAGTGATTFSPEASCTRGQIVTFLWRAAGSPVVTDAMDFTDVPADAYYAEAVRWAVAQGITVGTSATTFSPEAICTRGQIVTFLWRAADSPVVTDATGFTDVPAGAYYAEAVRWAVAQGITAGTSATTFSPGSICTRSQIVTFLFRAMGK